MSAPLLLLLDSTNAAIASAKKQKLRSRTRQCQVHARALWQQSHKNICACVHAYTFLADNLIKHNKAARNSSIVCELSPLILVPTPAPLFFCHYFQRLVGRTMREKVKSAHNTNFLTGVPNQSSLSMLCWLVIRVKHA